MMFESESLDSLENLKHGSQTIYEELSSALMHQFSSDKFAVVSGLVFRVLFYEGFLCSFSNISIHRQVFFLLPH